MCGFVGVLSFKSSSYEIKEPALVRMRDTMDHRGPDGAGVWISPNRKVGLGFRRLSIIDLSETANQPMCNSDQTVWLTFNGEIYNHAEIKKELQALGRRSWKKSHSDTEVVLQAFEQWGIDCIEKFRGMFAISIWDEKKRELWLIRDRIGVKPLYYSVHHGRIVFGSEIKALLEDPEQPRTLNEEGFYHYLSFLTTPAPQTLFEGIRKIPGGTWLRVSEDGSIREHKYWDVLDHVRKNEGSEEEICAQIVTELRTAVNLRKVSDVPVGVFLSGGIDSSTNAALFSEGETRPIRTFTIGYDGQYDSYQNETHYARKMANWVKADYYEKLLTSDDLLEFLPRMIRLQDEPIADPVCVPVYYVSKLAKDHGVTVCQVGEGADELFWGYRHWKLLLQLQQWNDLPVPPIFKKAGLAALKLAGQGRSRPYEFLRRGSEDLPIFWGGAEAFTENEKRSLISDRLKEKFNNYTSWEAIKPIHERFLEKSPEKTPLNWMTYLDLNFRLPELLLMRVDKMSMGASLEGRVPFLDHKFVEFAMGIPTSFKTKNGELKYLLKKAVRGLIPDEMIDRKKQGFAVPVHEWFFGKLGDQVRSTLTEFCDQTDLLDRKAALEFVGNPQNGKQAWYLLNFALWWKEFIR